jgi:hypothetical protein
VFQPVGGHYHAGNIGTLIIYQNGVSVYEAFHKSAAGGQGMRHQSAPYFGNSYPLGPWSYTLG